MNLKKVDMNTTDATVTVRTKGEFMKAVFTAEELRNIDSAIPIQYWKNKSPEEFDTFFYVMDFNSNCLGSLKDMREVAKERNLNINY